MTVFDLPHEALLRGRLPSLPRIVIQKTLRHDVDALVAEIMPRGKLAVVFDGNTRDCAAQVGKALRSRFSCEDVWLQGEPAADDVTAQFVAARTAGCDMLVAVGAGTINDVCKYAAAKDKKPYVVFPTAASMNGYVSANASISVGGHKATLAAAMPQGVFCDMGVIAGAPGRLAKSGLGDALARPTAQADWLLSHKVLGTDYDEAPFALLEGLEGELFDAARGIALNDAKSVELLMKLLLLSGFGMALAGGSYPASQGEHMIAHVMGMMGHAGDGQRGHTLHGEEIGVTALAMAQMQEQMLRGRPALRREVFNEANMTALLGEYAAKEAKQAFAVKQEKMAAASLADWANVAGGIERVHLPPARLRAVLEAAQAPVEAQTLGWEDADYRAGVEAARFTRERFGFLDLALKG